MQDYATYYQPDKELLRLISADLTLFGIANFMPLNAFMRKSLLILTLFFLTLKDYAQKPEQVLAAWGNRSPIEKIHLHFDRDNYVAGETAWFKAYLYSDYQPDTISTALYVELVNTSSRSLVQKVLPVLYGTTNGHIEIPDSLVSGTYYVRAWTKMQLNQNQDYIYSRHFLISGKKNNAAPVSPADPVRIEIFPEGGNLVAGLTNTVAFKATNENGLPVDFKGSLFNGKNEKITSVTALHDGMGMFDITPIAGQEYYLQKEGDPASKKFSLPALDEKGIALTLIPHPQGYFFEIRQTLSDPAFQASYIVGQMQHHLVFRQDFKTVKQDLQGVINTGKLHSGIMQVTIFNKDGLPLAERLCFVNNKEYILAADLVSDTIDFSMKSRNRLHVKLKDTVQGSFSISVTDADYELQSVREENIISRLLLSSDLRGYIHNPAWYFASDDERTQTALDLVMMTNGWRRFKWNSLAEDSRPGNYKDPAFINLAGKISLRDTKKPFDNKSLVIFITGSDSSQMMQMVRTDKDGNFSMDSLLFFGQARIMFSDSRGSKNQYIDSHLSADSITRPFFLPPLASMVSLPGELVISTQQRTANDYDAIVKEKGIMLEGVTIKSKRKTPIQELEERYASGMFSGFSEKTYDLTNTKETAAYANIFDYLQFKVPGLEIGNDGADYVLYYRQGPSISSMGSIPMTLFLNEIQTDANTLASIAANEVAMVKVFSTFVGASGNGAGGTMAVYTKKGKDLFNISSGRATTARYSGFSVIKQFYSPDYKVDVAARSKSDTRITLQWKPDIMITGVAPSIPVVFYNNDRTRRYKVVVEGMTVEGKMVYIEKIIER